jgi:hypothetical protein
MQLLCVPQCTARTESVRQPYREWLDLTAACRTIVTSLHTHTAPKLFVRLQNKQRKRGACIQIGCGDACRELPQDLGTEFSHIWGFGRQLRSCVRASRCDYRSASSWNPLVTNPIPPRQYHVHASFWIHLIDGRARRRWCGDLTRLYQRDSVRAVGRILTASAVSVGGCLRERKRRCLSGLVM